MRWLVLLFVCFPISMSAQGVATLVADQVAVGSDNTLDARGNVEVFYDGTKLSAVALVYDAQADQLAFEGPIIISSPDGTVFEAQQAQLDPKLTNGILLGARIVFDQRLQLAANQITRSEGRFSQLYKVAATSCNVCREGPPLWAIRAATVVHDEQTRQLFFTDASLRIRGVPILWLPRLRIPDPSLKRATGFLIPTLRTSDRLGTGIKIPYFLRLGDHRDLTLTPYISAKTTTLETRYRQAFASGDILINLYGSRDQINEGVGRAALFAEGRFDFRDDYELKFDIELASDRAYLLEYGYSSKDRLDSAIVLSRVNDSAYLQAGITSFQSLRDDETNEALPPLIGHFAYISQLPDTYGGLLRFGVTGDAFVRTGELTGDAGRDLARLGGFASWTKTFVSGSGLVSQFRLGLDANFFRTEDDPSESTSRLRAVPHVQAVLRYPLVGNSAGARHLVEPVVAVTWSQVLGNDPTNEDATRPEFDANNLTALTRLPGEDASEEGIRAAALVRWTRQGHDGSKGTLTFGRLYQNNVDEAFSSGTGLSQTVSDWVVSGQFDSPLGVRAEIHSLFDNDLSPSLASARIGWSANDISLSAAYVWQVADQAAARPNEVSEWSIDTQVRLNDMWSASFDARYDVAEATPRRAGIGLQWENECVVVDLSVSRRYTSSGTVAASTDYGLSVTLNGFSTKQTRRGSTMQCSKG